MAQTDTRPGFRLPWSSDRGETEPVPTTVDGETPSTEAIVEATDGATPDGSPAEAGAVGADADASGAETTTEPVAEPAAEPVVAPARKPTKFMAELTKAMQATAGAARAETMEKFTAEAKAATERVHAQAAEEAAELRRLADEDVAGIRDWSKAEIARIREETEQRISGRKADLERELEQHAGTIDGRIERVSAFVATFEAQIAEFYDRLFAEEDPTRFAAMAEQLPEPPALDLPGLDLPASTAVATGAATSSATAADDAAAAWPVADTLETSVATTTERDGLADAEAAAAAEAASLAEATAAVAVAEPVADPVAEPAADDSSAPVVADATEDAASTATAVTDTTDTGASFADAVDGRHGNHDLAEIDFAAAEAEASLSDDSSDGSGEEIPVIADEVLAARLAGLVPDEGGSASMVSSRVIVTGLVSVASIAGFKRHLARLGGAASVGVSSGPDGEFIFTVQHLATLDLADEIVGLPGFEARITERHDGTISVAASDPESHD